MQRPTYNADHVTENTNIDLTSSPRKIHDSKLSPKPSIRRRQTHNLSNSMYHNSQTTSQVHNISTIPPPNLLLTTDISPSLHEIKAEPLTPGPLALFSPTSTEPSFAARPPRDTPPPSIRRAPSTSSIDDVLPLRPSRRARPAVSYAEPSLNSKLRRPTDTLVDAVGRSDRRSDVVQHAPSGTADRLVHIKAEPPLEQQSRAAAADVVSSQPSSPSPPSSSALHGAVSDATTEAQQCQVQKRGLLTSSATHASRTPKPTSVPLAQPVRSSGRQRTPKVDEETLLPVKEAQAPPVGLTAATVATSATAQPGLAAVARNVRARASARRQTLVLRERDAADVLALEASPDDGGSGGDGGDGGGGDEGGVVRRESGVRRRTSLAY